MAMSEPAQVQLKRKRNEEPLDVLLLEGAAEPKHTRYVRQSGEGKTPENDKIHQPTQNAVIPRTRARQPTPNAAKRIFELQHKPSSISRKRNSGDDEELATFVEKVEKKTRQKVETATQQRAPEEESAPATPLKRPGKGSTLRTPTKPAAPAETEVERRQMEAIAAYMHEAALEEIKTETRPKTVAAPKLSGARSREIHRHRAATNGSVSVKSEMELDDDDSYVYDTYILAPTTDVGAIQVDELGQLDNVGYLVITDDDRSLWETYLEDEPSEKDWNSDEDDENAEGYYAADYPDDELLSDDEIEWVGYGYMHRGAPNDEEWDEDTGAYSDDEFKIRNGQVPQRFREFEREAFGR
jgi:hypothetical protein